MKKVIVLLMAILCVAGLSLMTSCSKSKSEIVLDEFENLVEEVEDNKGKLTADEWKTMHEDFNKRFEEMGIENLDEKDFSALEKIRLVGLTMRWAAAMAESSPSLLEGAIQEAQEETVTNE